MILCINNWFFGWAIRSPIRVDDECLVVINVGDIDIGTFLIDVSDIVYNFRLILPTATIFVDLFSLIIFNSFRTLFWCFISPFCFLFPATRRPQDGELLPLTLGNLRLHDII